MIAWFHRVAAAAALSCVVVGCSALYPPTEFYQDDVAVWSIGGFPLSRLQLWCEKSGGTCALADAIENPPDPRPALPVYQAGCAANRPADCRRLADFYRLGLVVDHDDARASRLYDEACRAGHAPACHREAAIWQYGGLGQSPDMAAAVARYDALCDDGYAPSCAQLASLFYSGNDVPRDRAAALDYAKRAGPDGENVLSLLYRYGEGVPEDMTRSRALRASWAAHRTVRCARAPDATAARHCELMRLFDTGWVKRAPRLGG